MSKIDTLISKLPKELQKIARRYLPMFVTAGEDEVKEWIGYIAAGNWRHAYAFTLCRMTTDQALAEQRRLNDVLLALNDDNAQLGDAKRAMVREVLLALFSLGLSALKK
jgi:hypothetical protein